MGLVERVRQQVYQGQLIEPQTTLQQHQAHLCAGRPGQSHLDADARHNDQSGDYSRQSADQHQQALRRHGGGKQRREAQQ